MTVAAARTRLAAFVLLIPQLVGITFSAYVGNASSSGSSVDLAFLVRVTGVLQGAVYLIMSVVVLGFAGIRPVRFQYRLERFYVGLGLVALLYFGITMLVPPVIGSTARYTIGDLYRSALPFVALIVLFSMATFNNPLRLAVLDTYVFISVALAVLGSLWKLYFAARGVFYGAGLLQYSIGGFVLPLLLIRFTYGRWSGTARCLWGGAVIFMILMSVMSLKRGVWVGLAITSSLVALLVDRKKPVFAFFTIMALVCGTAIIAFQLDAFIIARILYTLSGQHGVDRSTFTRVAEASGALYTLGQQGSPLAYLVGLGPGAEFVANPLVPMTEEQTGSAVGLFHHIHITPFLLLFRHGLIGLVVYGALLWPMVEMLWALKSKAFRAYALRHPVGQVFLAMLINHLSVVVLGIKGNILYGSVTAAIALFVMATAYAVVVADFERLRSSGSIRVASET